jgi:pSer/pThr/pTyr-binding forkhead associated (FHA) protein
VSEQRREIAIDKEEFLLGRGVDCDLRLSGASVSRHHCLIRIRGSEATLSDLGSSNGTYINGQRVRSQAALMNGDEVGVGDFRFTFLLAGVSGLQWGPSQGADPLAATCRIKDVRPMFREKEEGHPPGEAGGQKEGS